MDCPDCKSTNIAKLLPALDHNSGIIVQTYLCIKCGKRFDVPLVVKAVEPPSPLNEEQHLTQ